MKEIHLLQEQISRLDNQDFDFRSWKESSILLLSKIFGNDDQKVKQISKLEPDYSSWSLRDASGKSSQIETLKKLGKEILHASINEIESYGLPDKNAVSRKCISVDTIVSALESELKISQYKEIVTIINSNLSVELKKKEILNKFSEHTEISSLNILASILSSPDLKEKL